jgi:type III restriction enzyme
MKLQFKEQRRNDLHESQKLEKPAGLKLVHQLTIEMETGTGKTYTYIRTMYELNKRYGWSKFIIIVPSIAIREGAYKTFEVTQDHFQELYGHRIAPFISNSSRPQDIETFASDSRISVMIINTQAFNSSGEVDTKDNSPNDLQLKYTSVYANLAGDWKFVSWQSYRMRP